MARAFEIQLRGSLSTLALASLMWLKAAVSIAAVEPTPALQSEFQDGTLPLLRTYCLDCHSTEKQKGDLDLERFTSAAEVLEQPEVWEHVVEQMTLGEMPPKDKPQLTPAERERLLGWVNSALNEAALARAGDPGPVVLRRLSNAEYTYSIRDLTGVASLDPVREFPVDSAAGEGFMNVGNSLVMSPALVAKFLDAAKDVASHAMLLPDGIRFSPSHTRRDWTEELLGEIRDTYREYTDQGGGTSVNLQGIRFDTKDGGVLPLDRYLKALLEERAGISASEEARAGLSPKYLQTLRQTLDSRRPSFLLDPIRARWRQSRPGDEAVLAQSIAAWQHALWKFNSVGHIGKRDGPKSWMEPLTPLQAQQTFRLKLTPPVEAPEITLYLSASDAGDGNQGDQVVWEEPRFDAPGQPALLLRDLREVARRLSGRRDQVLSATTKYLAAAAEVESGSTNVVALAQRDGLEADALAAWLDYLGIGAFGPVKIEGHFTEKFSNGSGYAFINGWGGSGTPNLVANSSDQPVRIPGNMKPHSVAVHPSPTLAAGVGWRSPIAGSLRVTATIQHAHPECGNGVTWLIELRRGSKRQRLAHGVAHGGKAVVPAPLENIPVQPGDLISLLIGPRDANHSCDLTAVDLTIRVAGEGAAEWDLAKDVSPDVLAANPHADRLGNAGVWHFYTEPDRGREWAPAVPAGSLLAQWQAVKSAAEKAGLAAEIQRLLTSPSSVAANSPDGELRRQLTSLGGPLFGGLRREAPTEKAGVAPTPDDSGNWGIDPARFGHLSDGTPLAAASLGVHAPDVVEIRLPADLVAGYEFVTTGALHPVAGAEGSVQLRLLTNPPAANAGLLAIAAKTKDGEGPWYSNNRTTSHDTPIVVNEKSAARQRIEDDFAAFRWVFPAALCYSKIVPVDEVVTLTLIYREDHHFSRLMLDDAQAARLDRLWSELHFVAQDALTLVDVFEQLWQYATQDADPSVFEPMREPIQRRAAEFRQELARAEPAHVDAALKFADNAYRRPLSDTERGELRGLYDKLRAEEIPHDDAIRLMLARVLVAPAFLYRSEQPAPGNRPGPVTDWELATRLSYFLWSSVPDAELRSAAAQGRLRDPDVLAQQARRMLQDPRARRLATEFACAWLHVYDFDELGEKSERHFPTFAALRGAMYEETIRFFTDLFQRNGSVLEILDADATFLNAPLAQHYGVPFEQDPAREWQRVSGMKARGRGGVLGQATILAKQSGASRTSPILRGNWLAEVLLGEKLPRPPKDVPQLPEDEAAETLTVRQLTERHTTDPKCSGCHRRIDPYGYSLEAFDAIGRARERDLGGRPIDVKTTVMDGSEIDGLPGLRTYLLTTRRDAFLKQFCRKLLGYSLGRSVLLSDGPLIAEISERLKSNDHQVAVAVETIVRSPQFREIRGRDESSAGPGL